MTQLGNFMSKETRGKLRNQRISSQFGELIKKTKSIKGAHITFIKGRLHSVEFRNQDFCYMPTIEKGQVKMVYMGKVYAEYTVEEFIKKFSV